MKPISGKKQENMSDMGIDTTMNIIEDLKKKVKDRLTTLWMKFK